MIRMFQMIFMLILNVLIFQMLNDTHVTFGKSDKLYMVQVLNATNVTSFLLFQMLHMLQMFQMLRYPLTLNCTRAVHCCMCIKNTLQFSTNVTQMLHVFNDTLHMF